MKRIFLFFFLLPIFIYSQQRYAFIENKGQWEGEFLFKTDLNTGAMFIEEKGITYHFTDWRELRSLHDNPSVSNPNPTLYGHVIKTSFINSNHNPEVKTSKPQSYYHNYFRGDNQHKWVSKLYPVGEVELINVWDGVNVKYYQKGGQLKYDFIIEPNGNPNIIQLEYTGATEMSIKDEQLIIKTSVLDLIEDEPYAYQMINGKQKKIDCEFVLINNQVSFKLGNYDKSKLLVIDPTLIFASYSGSTADNFGMTATYDKNRNLYAGGMAYGPGYPTTAGAYMTTSIVAGASGITDVVISKYNASGSALIYSTYIGGGSASDGTETVHSMIVDSLNQLCIFGVTSSSNFPTTTGCYDSTFNGGTPFSVTFNGTTFTTGTDIYVTKFNPSGTALIGSTFVGGSSNDGINYRPGVAYSSVADYDSLTSNYGDQFRGEIVIDPSNNVYVASSTSSIDFPTISAFQSTFGGRQDAVIFKLNNNLSSLIYSSYIGGINQDAGYGVSLDPFNSAYVTGGTVSPDFPSTIGVYDNTFNGGKADAYLCKVNPTGNILLHSTFLGTNNYDQSFFVDTDPESNVYIFGQTKSPAAFPEINVSYSNPTSGQFITKFDTTLTNIIFSGKFGTNSGTTDISPTAFMVDVCGNMYVSGWGGNILGSTGVTGMPLTANALQSSTDGFNFYIGVIRNDFTSLYYGSYFGGGTSQEHVDGGTSRFSKEGIIYQSVCAGCGSNDDFPTTPGAWSNTNNSSNCNNGVFKIQVERPDVGANITPPLAACNNFNMTFNGNTNNSLSYNWNFGDGGTSTLMVPSHTYSSAGQYTVTLIVIDTIFVSCIAKDTVSINVEVFDSDTNYVLSTDSICAGESISIGIPAQSGHTYNWLPPNSTLSPINTSTTTATPTISTTYFLIDNDSVCNDTIQKPIIVLPSPNAALDFDFEPSCYTIKVQLINNSTDFTSYVYSLDGNPLVVGVDSFEVLLQNILHHVFLTVTNGSCTDTASIFINPSILSTQYELKMPNIFTPFSSPGLNDQFCPIGLQGEYCYQMYIYNRWGVEIWLSDGDEPCWDGKHKDTEQNAVDGVYFYVIEYAGQKFGGFLELLNNQ